MTSYLHHAIFNLRQLSFLSCFLYLYLVSRFITLSYQRLQFPLHFNVRYEKNELENVCARE